MHASHHQIYVNQCANVCRHMYINTYIHPKTQPRTRIEYLFFRYSIVLEIIVEEIAYIQNPFNSCIYIYISIIREYNDAKERQKLQNQFELFGCDYVFNNNFQPYLLEVNSGPVCKETEFEMIERMLNIVLPFGMNDDTEEEDDDDKIEQEKELRNINNKWVKVEM